MCTMGAMIATTIAATALSMGGQYMQAQAQEKSARAAADYNAQVAANEAATQQQLAQNEIQKGISDRERQQRAAARSMGEMRANMGASGFQMDSGSMLSLLEESATEHQYDSNIIRQNSEQAAWQHLVGVTSANNSGAFASYQRDNAGNGRLGTYLGMGGTLLGGIGSAIQGANQWNSTSPGRGKYYDKALQSYVSSPVRH